MPRQSRYNYIDSPRTTRDAVDEITNVRSEPFLIIASQYTIELLCCGVAKIVSVVGSPAEGRRRVLIVSVSSPFKELFINQSYVTVNPSTGY